MSGHVRISQQLVFKYAHTKPELLAFLATYEVDLYRGTVKSTRSYARMWGTSRGTISRTLAYRQRTIDDLQNQVVAAERGPLADQRRATGVPPANHNSSAVTEAPAKQKRTKRRAPRAPHPVPEELTAKEMAKLLAWCEQKHPWWNTHLPDLVEACLIFHRKDGNKRGYSDWVAVSQTWVSTHEKWDKEKEPRAEWHQWADPAKYRRSREQKAAYYAANPHRNEAGPQPLETMTAEERADL